MEERAATVADRVLLLGVSLLRGYFSRGLTKDDILTAGYIMR